MMPFNLSISEIKLPTFSSSIGSNRVRSAYIKEQLPSLTPLIIKDMLYIVEHGLNSALIEDFQQEIITPLNNFFSALKNIQSADIQKELSQPLRILSLVMRNRLNMVNHEGSKNALVTLLDSIDTEFGVVPRLNQKVALPDERFLPPNFKKSKEGWQKKTFSFPSRKSSSGGNLRFFSIEYGEVNQDGKKPKVASVRCHLIALDANNENENEAISYADADIYAVGDLQADHMQPSEQIVERQQEMLDAMNIDPIFASQVNEHPESSLYFKETAGVIEGTKYFYLVYHNCIDNLWLISAAANTGAGKGNIDPITWLANHSRFGQPFFLFLGGYQSIDKSTILYTANGKVLAQQAKDWFLLTYNNEINAAKYIRRSIATPLKSSLADMAEQDSSKKNRRKTISAMAKMVLAKELMGQSSHDSSSDQASSSGASTPEHAAQVTVDNMLVMEGLVSDTLKQTFRDVTKQLTSEFRQELKRPRPGSPK